jgi:hypothetical protein
MMTEAHASGVGGMDAVPKPGALYALIVLTVINLLNYCDRYIPSSTSSLLISISPEHIEALHY